MKNYNGKISGKKILITGGAGFIGTTLTKKMVAGNQLVILDNFHRNALKYTELNKNKNVTIFKGDVCDLVTVQKAMKGCSMVVHLAAIAGVDTVVSMPVRTMEVALIGTYNVLKTAYEIGGIKKLIDFSTSEIFGTYAYKVTEKDSTTLGAVGEARWTYAVSKLATEHLAHNYFREYKLPTVIIRPFNIYGPNQVGVGAIHHFVVAALLGKDIIIHNDGNQIRAWCYIDDIIRAVLMCLSKSEAVGQVFNIGNPRSTITIYHLARLILDLTKSKSNIRFEKRNIQDVELRIPDISRARSLLGFEPKVELNEGLKNTIEWYRSHL